MATKQLATTKRSAPATITEADLDISGIPTLEEVSGAIQGGYKLHVDSDGQGDSVLLGALKNAKSKADLAAISSGDLEKMADHLGEWLTVTAIDGVNNADPGNDGPGTLGVYLVVSATTPDGEAIKMAIGAKQPFSYLVALNEWGELPARVMFEKAKRATKAGFFPINCVVADGDF